MKKKEGRYIGLIGTVTVHVLILLLLVLVSFALPQAQEEGGMPVLLGDVPDAYGFADPSLVDVDVLAESVETADPEPISEDNENLIVQEEEETVAVSPKTSEKPKVQTTKPVEKKKVPTEEEIREANAKAAAEKAEAERKAVESAARNRVSGAFGRGTQMGSKGNTQGEGIQGSPEGNSDTGATSGVGGYGSFSLSGRSLGPGGLPRPSYNVSEEGRVVVTITVNPAGQVISTSISPQTNTVNSTLRRAAEEAAKKARFNSVDGNTNQTGTITYEFKLK